MDPFHLPCKSRDFDCLHCKDRAILSIAMVQKRPRKHIAYYSWFINNTRIKKSLYKTEDKSSLKSDTKLSWKFLVFLQIA